MNKKNLYKALCLLPILTVYQVDAALLISPNIGSGYSVDDYCVGCPGMTYLDVNIQDNVPITLEFDPMGALYEDIYINLMNNTGTAWSSLTIEYTVSDPFDPVQLGLTVLETGSSIPTIDAILSNPDTGLPSGLALSFMPSEYEWVTIVGSADRFISNPFIPYSITISTNAVPVPAAVWLFGSGLIGLVGLARRKA